jgi:glyoxalase family protein
MAFVIAGLHHVTATVDQAQPDLDFCIRTLGLRLVKKTVNFDNHRVYHFYYGDERGTPGTIWTTFPYHGRGVRIGTKGDGQITVTSFSVPTASLPFWTARLKQHGVPVVAPPPRFGERSIIATDPSGLLIELVETDRDVRGYWEGGGVDADDAVRGLHGVSLTLRTVEPTIGFLSEWLGFSLTERGAERVRLGVNGGGPGKQIDLIVSPDAPPAVNGIGTVHHVAVAVDDQATQVLLRDELLERGIKVTPVMDRQYFQSIYFREPGGVLFEVATMRPGFDVDEPASQLGQSLKLPPWEEASREEIERGLVKVRY